MSAARQVEYTSEPVLFLALELSAARWKVGTTVGLGQKPREMTIEAGDLGGLTEEIAREALHQRLNRRLRLIDWVCFMCEHDDHHLAVIGAIRSQGLVPGR